MGRRPVLATFSVIAVLAAPATALACSGVALEALTPPLLVERAPVIVHVRARDYCRGSAQECSQLPVTIVGSSPAAGETRSIGGPPGIGVIDFEVIQVIEGPRRGTNVMTPYWAPLAPINEQVRSSDDPWLQWVRRQVEGKR